MRNSLRKTLALALACLMMLTFFVACKQTEGTATTTTTTTPTNTGTDTSTSTEEPVTITMWWYPRYSIPNKDPGVYEKELADQFTKLHPNVTIEHEMLAWDSGPEKINVAITANTMPDAVFDYPGRIIGYGAQGALVDLTDMIPADVKADIPDSIWEHCMLDGKIYMFPNAVGPVVMAVNVGLFKEAGADKYLPDPNGPRTWKTSDFTSALDLISKHFAGKGVYGMAFYAKNEQGDASVRMFMQNQGTDFVAPDHKSIVLNSDAGVAALQLLLDYNEKGYLVPGAQSMTSSEALELFIQSKAASIPMFGAGNIKALNTAIEQGTADPNFELMLVCQPTPDGSQAKVEAQATGFCVFDNKDPARAQAMMDFILFQSAMPETIATQNIFPVRSSMSTDTMGDFYQDPNVKFLATLTPYIGDTGYTINSYAKIRAAFYPEIQAALTGAKTAKQALDDFVANANPLLSE